MGILPCGISSLWHRGGQRQVYLPDLLHFRRQERTISGGSIPRVAAPRDARLSIKALLMCWDHVLCDHQAMVVTKQWIRSPSDDLMANTSLVVGKERDGLTCWRKFIQVLCCLDVLHILCSPLSHGLGVISCWRCPAFPIHLEMFPPASGELLELPGQDLGDGFTWGEERRGLYEGLSVYF